MVKKRLKSESTKHVLTQTDNSYRKYGTLCTSIIEMKIVQSFEKHYSFIIAILFYKNRLNLTEENKNNSPAGSIQQCN